jgi:hypothetical protein
MGNIDFQKIDLGNFHEYSKKLKEIFQSGKNDSLYYRLKLAITDGEITVNYAYLPSNAKIFSIMFLNKFLTETAICAIIGEDISIVDPLVEHRNDILKAIHASIWLDVYVKDETARVFTLDMQRTYLKTRSRNRNVYYGAKELASQNVEDGRYEKLKQVSITFIFEKNTTPGVPPIAKVQFADVNTHEIYTDLVTLYEVNLNIISPEQGHPDDLLILQKFLLIQSQNDLLAFVQEYDTVFSRQLVVEYMNAILDDSVLLQVGGSEKFMIKLTEDLLREERAEGKLEGDRKSVV